MYIEEWFSFWKNDLLFRNESKTNNIILSFKEQWDKLDITLHFFINFRNFDKALDEFEPDFILYNAGMTDFNLILITVEKLLSLVTFRQTHGECW